MSKQQLSRRKVLAGLATAGGGSAFVGSGASALFTDEETFENNAVQASASVAGEMKLNVDWDPDFDNFSFSAEHESVVNQADPVWEKTKVIPAWRVRLPSDPANNPAYIWLRLKECPPKWAFFIWVHLYIDCEDGPKTLARGNLLEVADTLRQGITLDSDCPVNGPTEQSCFYPGEDSVRLVLDWGVNWGRFFTHSSDTTQVPIPFEFYATQCRYNDGSTNPFPQPADCDKLKTRDKGISFLAFCSDKSESIGAGVEEVHDWNDGEPTDVTWTSDELVSHVLVKTGNADNSKGSSGGGRQDNCKMYTYSGGSTEGRVDTSWPPTNAEEVPCENVTGPNPCSEAGQGKESVKLAYDAETDTWEDED